MPTQQIRTAQRTSAGWSLITIPSILVVTKEGNSRLLATELWTCLSTLDSQSLRESMMPHVCRIDTICISVFFFLHQLPHLRRWSHGSRFSTCPPRDKLMTWDCFRWRSRTTTSSRCGSCGRTGRLGQSSLVLNVHRGIHGTEVIGCAHVHKVGGGGQVVVPSCGLHDIDYSYVLATPTAESATTTGAPITFHSASNLI